MYRALYDFEATDDGALSFSSEDRFTVMETSDPYWWLVQNGFGNIGYVPANYLDKDEATANEVIRSIDRAIEAIHFQATCNGGQFSKQQRANLQKLLQHRKNMIEKFRIEKGIQFSQSVKRVAPQPPPIAMASSQPPGAPSTPTPQRHQPTNNDNKPMGSPSLNKDSTRRSTKNKSVPVPPGASSDSSSGESSSQSESRRGRSANSPADPNHGRLVNSPRDKFGSPSSSPNRLSCHVPPGIAHDLVELMRRNTGLSYEKSKVAVGTVLSHLRENVQPIRNVMDDILKDILKRESSLSGSCHDAVRLEVIFSEMAACKDDSQQRSWALHEDEHVILEYIDELYSILTNADPKICKEVVAKDSYSAVHTLVLYYQMETRVSIRLPLLKVFGAMCSLDRKVICELLTSVLPLELARDMQTDYKDVVKLKHSALVLTMIFSIGESIPIHHYDNLSRIFIGFLLQMIEEPAAELHEDADEIIDLFINLVLAFNLHFDMPSENTIMQILEEQGTAKNLTERILLLINRGVDPVNMFEHTPKTTDSLLKFLSDLYSSPNTASIFYTNDAKVLIDITIRQLEDLPSGDKVRTEYLSLVHLIFKNSDYLEERYRHSHLQRCLNHISGEENPDSEMDRVIIKQIWREFPNFFSSESAV